MDMNNLIFIMLIAMLLFTGTSMVIADSARNAPVPYTNVTMSLGTSTTKMAQIINDSTTQATEPQVSEDPLTLAFGYIKGAYSAVTSFFAMLDVSQNMVTWLALTSGFIPIQFVVLIQAALAAVFFIGILYYWTRVK